MREVDLAGIQRLRNDLIREAFEDVCGIQHATCLTKEDIARFRAKETRVYHTMSWGQGFDDAIDDCRHWRRFKSGPKLDHPYPEYWWLGYKAALRNLARLPNFDDLRIGKNPRFGKRRRR